MGLARFSAGRFEPRLHQLDRWLDGAYACADQLRHVLSDIQGRVRREPEDAAPLDVLALLDTALSMAEAEAGGRARMVRDYERVPRITGSGSRLLQGFLNLLTNALRAIPGGNPDENEIIVRLREDAAGAAIVIEISDTGCGMSDTELARATSPYCTSTAKTGGMGLGLSISTRIVSAHGGRLLLEPNQPRGTVARIILPRRS